MNSAPPEQAVFNENSDPFQRALVRHQQGDLDAAAAACNAILVERPREFDAVHLLAILAAQRKQFGLALTIIHDAIGIRPTSAPAYFNRGAFFEQLQRLDHALESYERATQLDPNLAVAHLRRGVLMQRGGRFEAALQSYDRVIAVAPEWAGGHLNRAILLQDLWRLEEALLSADKALVCDSRYTNAHSVRGCILADLGRWDKAAEAYDCAIASNPSSADAHVNRAIAWLVQGDFKEGLVEYEWRLQRTRTRLIGRAPRWTRSQSLEGKTILLYGEQGLGDTIQFCRYATLVSARGARVILYVRRALRGLLDGLDGVAAVVTTEEEIPECDFVCPLMSLPLELETTIDTIPSSHRYLRADSTQVDMWRAKLRQKARPCVALAWRGNPAHPRDAARSIPLDLLMRALPDDLRYVALSCDLPHSDLVTLRSNTCIEVVTADLCNVAAVCECMDLVISVDTCLAHLSAALGQKTWILLPFNSDWRWLQDRVDSPWYPSVRLFRQTRAGYWGATLDHIRNALHREFA